MTSQEEEEKKKAKLAERKRKRLEAWRKRQQEEQAKKEADEASTSGAIHNATTNTASDAAVSATGSRLGTIANNTSGNSVTQKKAKVSISLMSNSMNKKKKLKKSKKNSNSNNNINPIGFHDDNDDSQNNQDQTLRTNKINDDFFLPLVGDKNDKDTNNISNKRKAEDDKQIINNTQKKKRRWDVTNSNENDSHIDVNNKGEEAEDDDLDKFMNQLEAGALGAVAVQNADLDIAENTIAHVNNKGMLDVNLSSGGVITPEILAKLTSSSNTQTTDESNNDDGDSNNKVSNESEMMIDVNISNQDQDNVEIDDDEEEQARRNFLAALRKTTLTTEIIEPPQPIVAQLASEVQSEKHRREAHMEKLRKEAAEAQRAQASQPDIGRIFYSDVESGVMEEAERNLDVMTNASVDALEVLAELNKKKELKAVDHSAIEYLPIRKNLYIVPRSVSNLTEDEVMERRVKHKIRVRGRGAPAPVETFEECGLSERILAILRKMKIVKPFAIQAQCLPCCMAGRDVIGIAKTGSGKTLAYLLPMLRHIGDQPDLAPHESGPIGLVLAPARELAVQIHSVCKSFAKQLGIK